MTQQHFRLVRIISGIAGRALPIASLSALLCACSADVVNMGDDANGGACSAGALVVSRKLDAVG
jgi:hypothetical protein